MSIKDLLKELSQESEEVAAAEQVLDEGELLDGTPVSGQKESAIKEMMDHAEKARMMSSQLNELADKADEILKEDKEHLVNEITTEAFQMNYRHIMENAGLLDAVVTFESANKTSELNYLSNEARKMAIVADNLEARILDYSEEGKIWSFFRRDKAKIANSVAALRRVSDPSKRGLTVTAIHKSHYVFMARGGRPITNLEAEIKTDVSLLIETETELEKRLSTLRDNLKNNKAIDSFKPGKLRILDQGLLGNKEFQAQESERKVGLVRTGFSLLAGIRTGLIAPFLALSVITLSPIGIIWHGFWYLAWYKVSDGLYNKESEHVIDLGSFAGIKSELDKLSKILNQSRNERIITEIDSLMKNYSGEDKEDYKQAVKDAVKMDSLIYEHAFFIVNEIRTLAESAK